VSAAEIVPHWQDECKFDHRIAAGDPFALADVIRDAASRLAETADRIERGLGLE
jgi:hypothetical protein